MNKLFFTSFIVSILLTASCNNNYKSKAEMKRSENTNSLAQTQESEDFDVFLSRFQEDSVFQKERIIFPLKTLSYNTDTDIFDESTINKKEWEFTNFKNLPNNYIKNITRLNNNEFNYNIQIDDTGVSVNYIFKIQNDRWYLVVIKDEST